MASVVDFILGVGVGVALLVIVWPSAKSREHREMRRRNLETWSQRR